MEKALSKKKPHVGNRIYAPCETNVWIPAVIQDYDADAGQLTVTVSSGLAQSDSADAYAIPVDSLEQEERVINLRSEALLELMGDQLAGQPATVTSLPLQNPDMGALGVDDMVDLNHLHEPAILYNVRTRFLADCPYTYTGEMCIAVNPYKWLDLYGERYQREHYENSRKDLPPHVFSISAQAFRDMRDRGGDHSILVSGESGAGKTETTKILMNHMAGIQRMAAAAASGSASASAFSEVEENPTVTAIIRANPLLEAFGNAKTVRNDNSSRFGKFTQMLFGGAEGGALVGARSRTYLLEKSRVLQQVRDATRR
jgi:myosin-5